MAASQMAEISLRPYNGKLYFTKTAKQYMKAHKKLFKTPDIIKCDVGAKFTGGEGTDGFWTYLIYANEPHTLAHEVAHVVFHIFERCGLNPSDSGGEAFCYFLSQIMLDIKELG